MSGDLEPIGDFSDADLGGAPASVGPVGDFSDAVIPGAPKWSGPERVKIADAIAAAKAAGVDPDLYVRLVFNGETGGNARALSKKGAIGPAQLMPQTAHDLGVNPYDTVENLNGGARYLKQALDHYKGDKTKAVAAYNAGMGAVDAAGGVPDYQETRDYVKRVLEGDAPVDGPAAAGAPTLSDADTEATFKAMHPGFNDAPAGAAPITHITWDAKSGTYRDAQGKAYGFPQGQNVSGPGGVNFKIVPDAPAKPGQIPVQLDSGTGESLADKPSLQGMVADQDRRSFLPGLEQGVKNVGGTFLNLDQAIEHNIPGASALNLFTDPNAPTIDQRVQAAHAERILNDAKYGSSPAYGAGKFTGEVGASLPAMAVGGELAGAAAKGVSTAAPFLAPAADFLAGNAGGNLFLRGGSLAANGALQGAEASALTSGGSDVPFLNQVEGGAVGGGLLGPAVPAVTGGFRFGGRTLARAFQPLTEGGRGKIADSVIREFAGDGPHTFDVNPYIEGSSPTLSQATGNPGLAGAERVLRDVRPSPFVQREQQNAGKRIEALGKIAGTPETVEELEAARDGRALPILHSALGGASPAEAQPIVDAIDAILKSPSGKRNAVVSNLADIRSKLFKADGSLETDADQLYGVRSAIGDLLHPLSARNGSNAQLASRELMQVKNAIDGAIEGAAPGYKDYLKTYARMSAPVNAQTYLQGLNLTDAQGNITLAKVKTALDGIRKRQRLSGVNDAKSISPEQIGTLEGLYADLKRQSNTQLGKSHGATTFQNLAMNNLFARAGTPLMAAGAVAAHHPLLAPLAVLGRMAYSAQNAPILDQVTNRFLDPELGRAALQEPVRGGFLNSGPVRRAIQGVNDNLVPAGALFLNNAYGTNSR